MTPAAPAPERCPACGASDTARILYGLPAFTGELEEEIEAGQIELGGCVVSGDDPSHRCRGCGHRWKASGP